MVATGSYKPGHSPVVVDTSRLAAPHTCIEELTKRHIASLSSADAALRHWIRCLTWKVMRLVHRVIGAEVSLPNDMS